MSTRIVRTLGVSFVFVVGLAVGRWIDTPAVAAQGTPTIFELRTYTAAPGKLDDLHKRLRDASGFVF